MTLRDLHIGQSAVITRVGGTGSLRQHFLDMGVIPGSKVKLMKYAPFGDPMELLIHGYVLALRLNEAEKIDVSIVEKEQAAPAEMAHTDTPDDIDSNNKSPKNKTISDFIPNQDEHPGLGEENYHCKKNEHPLPKNEKLTFALVGNQNSGKTTLFNRLTGANQHVGNFPGVTVDRKSGVIKGHPDTLITDLPGIYSLSPYSQEEIITRSFVLEQKLSCIINIVDANSIDRSLYLTMQLLELGIPMVLALNMMDEIENNGGTIRVNKMEELLGIPVIPISASKNQGISELVEHAVHVARYQEAPLRQDFCKPTDHGGAVHRCTHAIMHLIEDHAQRAHIPLRFATSKLIEHDSLVESSLHLSQNEKETVDHILAQMEEERGLDAPAALADMRFSFITNLTRQTVVKPVESKEHIRSQHIDRILTGRFTAIPVFILIMAVIFLLTFNVIGLFFQDLIEQGVEWLTQQTDHLLRSLEINDAVRSLVIDGVFQGVGTVLSFLPIIVVLFFFLSLLEDSGYMARIAFVMDKLLRKIGLSGRSIVPLLIGFGCSVPAVMSTRTLPSERDRKLTIILTPFMSCTAKIAIYAFFCAAFFPHHAALVMMMLYLLGILVGIVAAVIYNKTLFKGEPVPFVMELPNYRMPGSRNVLHLLWDKSRDFLQRAFTVIFAATIVIWFLQSFDFHLQLVSNTQNSILATLAGYISPIFSPIGFNDWRITSALVTGFLAKESVVGTIQVVFGSVTAIQQLLSIPAVASLLVFCLLYTPCVATIATIKREQGGSFALMLVIFQCLVAWVVAFICYHVLCLIM